MLRAGLRTLERQDAHAAIDVDDGLPLEELRVVQYGVGVRLRPRSVLQTQGRIKLNLCRISVLHA